MHHIWEKLQLFPNVYIATDSVKVVQEAKKLRETIFFLKEFILTEQKDATKLLTN